MTRVSVIGSKSASEDTENVTKETPKKIEGIMYMRSKTYTDGEDDIIRGQQGLFLAKSFVEKGSDIILRVLNSKKYLEKQFSEKERAMDQHLDHASLVRLNVQQWTNPNVDVLKPKMKTVALKDLPYRVYPKSCDRKVCMIVPDKEGFTPAEVCALFIEAAKRLDDNNEYDAIAVSSLKEYLKNYESQRKFKDSADLFICDYTYRDKIHETFGSIFRRYNKFPVMVNLSRAGELKSVLKGTHFTMKNQRGLISYPIGHSKMTAEQLSENVIKSLNSVAKMVPGGWGNVKVVSLMGPESVAVPIHDCSDRATVDHLYQIYQKCEKKKRENMLVRRKRQMKPMFDKNAKDDAAFGITESRPGSSINDLVKVSKEMKFFARKQRKFSKQLGEKPEEVDEDGEIEGSVEEDDVEVGNDLQKEEEQPAPAKKRKSEKAKTQKKLDQLRAPVKKTETPVKKSETPMKENTENLDHTTAEDVSREESSSFAQQVSKQLKAIRSTTDAAVKKTEDRKLKRKLNEKSEKSMKLTGLEQKMFNENGQPKSKKQKVAEPSSPRLTGLEKHLLAPSSSKKSWKLKKNDEKLTGRERFLFTGKGEKGKNKQKQQSEDVDIPEDFFAPDKDFISFGGEAEDTVADTIVAPPSTAKKARRTARNSSAAENTPLRRSKRISSFS